MFLSARKRSMTIPKIPDTEFMELYRTKGPYHISKISGLRIRGIYIRRENLEIKYKIRITAPTSSTRLRPIQSYPGRLLLDIPDGIVLVGSDGHYWPGEATVAHRAFVSFCKEYRPKTVIFNGDAFDGARISRHVSIMWENKPTVEQEIEAVQDRLSEIEKATFKARKIWTLGNHDARFETRLATVAPEFARVHGVHLKDHFPNWETAWSVWINDEVVIKHRFRNGIHAAHNNTVNAGKSIITGHLHSLKVMPFDDYNGTRWGVDTGCLADPYGAQFLDYTEDSPRNHRSGFIMLTFKDGVMRWPEIISVVDETHVDFRGQLIEV